MVDAAATTTTMSIADEYPALATVPTRPRAWLLLAHGAGAGMRHTFMETMATALAAENVATLRYEFPYMSRGRKLPDRQAVLLATVDAALDRGFELAGPRPLFAGGKSMGGRMTSLALSRRERSKLGGLVLLGFPLTNRGATVADRAAHLRTLSVPMLFVQGTRDKLAPLPELESELASVPAPTQLHIVEGADHAFAVPKKLARDPVTVIGSIATAIRTWIDTLVERAS